MANQLLWDQESSITSYLTTELNALANAGRKLGAEFTTSQKMYLNVELSLAEQASARSSGAWVSLYVIPALDGATGTYAYGSDSLTPSVNHLVGRFYFDAAVTARVDVVEKVYIGAGRYKIMVINNTGQAFAATGNTVRYSLSTPEVQ